MTPIGLPPAPPKIGMWAVLHEIRSDYAQIMTSAFLLINGPGKWSLDALLKRKKTTEFRPAQAVAALARKESAKASAMV